MNEIKIDEAREILAKVGATGFRVFVDYNFAYNQLNHKPSIDEICDISTLDKNTIITFVGALKEHGVIKEKTQQEEALDLLLESEFDDLLQRNVDMFLFNGTFTSTDSAELCIKTLKEFTEKKCQNNPSKADIYRRCLAKRLDLVSKI